MLNELPTNCPPVREWSTDPQENARLAPHVGRELHAVMAAFARQRDDMVGGKLKSRGEEPGVYQLNTHQAIDGNDLPDGCVLTFMAHAENELYQSVSVNGGPPFLLLTDKLEMGPKWLRLGGIYTIVFDKSQCIWVIRPFHEVIDQSGGVL